MKKYFTSKNIYPEQEISFYKGYNDFNRGKMMVRLSVIHVAFVNPEKKRAFAVETITSVEVPYTYQKKSKYLNQSLLLNLYLS